jgi:hypothetical protein
VYSFFISPMYVTCPTHLIPLVPITIIIGYLVENANYEAEFSVIALKPCSHKSNCLKTTNRKGTTCVNRVSSSCQVCCNELTRVTT